MAVASLLAFSLPPDLADNAGEDSRIILEWARGVTLCTHHHIYSLTHLASERQQIHVLTVTKLHKTPLARSQQISLDCNKAGSVLCCVAWFV